MIRDFCDIARGTLDAEIEALDKALEENSAPQGVSPESVAAIDAVPKVGNIGAHMEKDINLIIDVDPDEARKSIVLIEVLFEEWYVARHKRQQQLADVLAVAEKTARRRAASAREKPNDASGVIPDDSDAE